MCVCGLVCPHKPLVFGFSCVGCLAIFFVLLWRDIAVPQTGLPSLCALYTLPAPSRLQIRWQEAPYFMSDNLKRVIGASTKHQAASSDDKAEAGAGSTVAPADTNAGYAEKFSHTTPPHHAPTHHTHLSGALQIIGSRACSILTSRLSLVRCIRGSFVCMYHVPPVSPTAPSLAHAADPTRRPAAPQRTPLPPRPFAQRTLTWGVWVAAPGDTSPHACLQPRPQPPCLPIPLPSSSCCLLNAQK